MLGGVLPTPAVALLAQDLGLVVSASHNPPEYNGVKIFDRDGHKLSDEDELEIEALLDDAGHGDGAVEHADDAVDGYVEHILEHFGTDLSGLRIAVDCANGAFSAIAPGVFERLGAHVTAIATAPDGSNINVGCGATDLSLLQSVVARRRLRPRRRIRRRRRPHACGRRARASRSTATRSWRSAPSRSASTLVAVTSMTNLGFHRLMEEHGIAVVTTDVGDRHVLEALRREGGVLGGEQSGH